MGEVPKKSDRDFRRVWQLAADCEPNAQVTRDTGSTRGRWATGRDAARRRQDGRDGHNRFRSGGRLSELIREYAPPQAPDRVARGDDRRGRSGHADTARSDKCGVC